MSERTWLHWNFINSPMMSSPSILSMSERTWLHWNLPVDFRCWDKLLHYPCLKGRGSIETIYLLRYRLLRISYPCLKGRGSIETSWYEGVSSKIQPIHVWKDVAPLKPLYMILVLRAPFLYPCLKGRGSIEMPMRPVTGDIKMLNSGGIKLSTCQSLTIKTKGLCGCWT